MFKSIKLRLYPSKVQQQLIDQTLGCCRLIYNKGLEKRQSDYNNDVKTGYCQTSKMLTELKHTSEFAFLKTCDSVALQTSLRDLDKAFANFFAKRAKYPNFKSKHNHRQSYRTLNVNNGSSIRVEGKHSYYTDSNGDVADNPKNLKTKFETTCPSATFTIKKSKTFT